MLSHMTTSNTMSRIGTRQHHRRQQSTPVPFEAGRMPCSSPVDRNTPGYFGQDAHQVGITNPGQHHIQQHLQVAQQQQQQQARPGLFQPSAPQLNQSFPMTVQEYRMRQHQQLDAQIDLMMRLDKERQFQHHKMERSRSQPEVVQGIQMINSSQHNVTMMNLETSQINQTTGHERPSSSRSMSTYDDRMALLQRDWQQHLERPYTPGKECNSGNSPMTPVATPYNTLQYEEPAIGSQPPRQVLYQDLHQAVLHISPGAQAICQHPIQIGNELHDLAMDPNETIRPNRRGRKTTPAASARLVLTRSPQRKDDKLPSPPNTAPMKMPRTFDVSPMTLPGITEPVTDFDFETAALLQHDIQQNASAHIPSASLPGSPNEIGSHDDANSQASHVNEHDSPRTSIDYGNFESSASDSMSEHDMGVDELTLEGTIEDTGVTADDIQQYISEQDAVSGKWTCLFDGCGKVFGRKENIRSHVQTHLGDRQFRCANCDKRFVRQHDLKRHAMIHVSERPYECPCGRGFARHDALTRHRQRNICMGGHQGIVKKTAKRGRPRKARPDKEERMDKSARTRQRAHDRSYAGSISEVSEFSYPATPAGVSPSTTAPMQPEELDMASGELKKLLQHATAIALPPEAFTSSPTPPMSPHSTHEGYEAARAPLVSTPQTYVSDQSVTPVAAGGSDMSRQMSAVGSQISSGPNSPPELSHSSPPSSTSVFDEFSNAFPSNEHSKHDTGDIDFDMFVEMEEEYRFDENSLFDAFDKPAKHGQLDELWSDMIDSTNSY